MVQAAFHDQLVTESNMCSSLSITQQPTVSCTVNTTVMSLNLVITFAHWSNFANYWWKIVWHFWKPEWPQPCTLYKYCTVVLWGFTTASLATGCQTYSNFVASYNTVALYSRVASTFTVQYDMFSEYRTLYCSCSSQPVWPNTKKNLESFFANYRYSTVPTVRVL